MKVFQLADMFRGWFVGNFDPSILKTNDVEIAVKQYSKGDYESPHFHEIATEITVIVSGSVKMNDIQYKEGDIIVIAPGEITDFLCLKDGTKNVVVKYPGANNDKYQVE